MSGLTRADFDCEIVEVWPENWRAFCLLCDLQTQWRGAGTTIVGLDYNVMYRKMDRMDLSAEEYDELESDMRTAEAGALDAINAKD